MRDLQHQQMLEREQAAIERIPVKLRDLFEQAQKEFEKRGGCPGCKSMLLAVHTMPCSELEKHPFD